MDIPRRAFLGGAAAAGLPAFAGVNLFGAAASAAKGTEASPWETADGSAAEIENLRWTVTVLAVAAAVLFIGAAVLGTLLIRSITRPVRKVKR